MFYEELSATDKKDLAKLINSGQLEIVGGGWVQHDETLTTYYQQMTQMEAGIDWLQKTFPDILKSGRLKTMWQLDPFGSSENTPNIFGTE